MNEAAVAGIRGRSIAYPTLTAAAPRHLFATEVLYGCEAYEALASECRRLAHLHPGATLFQDAHLITAWARHFASSGAVQLATIVVREGARPVLIWPLSIERHGLVRIARGAGTPIGQYDEVMVDPGADSRAALSAALEVLRTSIRADVLQLERVRADGLLRTALRDVVPLTSTETAPYVDLSGGLDAALARRPRYATKQHRKRVKRFTKAGDCSMALAATAAEAEAWTREALGLKSVWLRDNGLLSRAFVRRETADCLAELAHALHDPSASPRMVIAKLCLDGRTAAIEVGFVHGKNFHLYLRAFAPDLSYFGPGNVLTERMLEWCAGNGIERYDMLPPRSRNKSEWQSGEVAVADYVLPMTWRGKLYAACVPTLLAPMLRDLFYALPTGVRSVVAGMSLRM
jgi:CelD/BcsL family acetyltransferase involved in cellulose biosynthesis